MNQASPGPAPIWRDRTEAVDWDAVRDELDHYGCALTGPLLTPGEAAEIAALYADDSRFRSTIIMSRYRFGEGEYRYFAQPYPGAVAGLRQALYPRLLPIARDWWAGLGREAPWPDGLDEWLRMCHDAGQTRPTPILLKYGAGDWNALHRDLYGELVFPLQVVINLSNPGTDHTAANSCSTSSGPGPSPVRPRSSSRTGTASCSPPGTAR